jgi:putative heme iron utilization protein
MKPETNLANLADDYRALITAQRSLLLATSNSEGDAEISYAPYVRIEQEFYIFVSELARHTGNMLRSRRASVMFIQPEAEAANLFARRRLIFSCKVAEIRADDARYTPILEALQQACGDVVGLDFFNRLSFVGAHAAARPIRGRFWQSLHNRYGRW